MPRKPLGVILTWIFGILALAAWVQAIPAWLGWWDKPSLLVALQSGMGVTATATGWASWRRARWAPVAALAYGALSTGLLLTLPHILDLPAQARTGLHTGAAVIVVFTLFSAAYFRSDALRNSQIGAERASDR